MLRLSKPSESEPQPEAEPISEEGPLLSEESGLTGPPKKRQKLDQPAVQHIEAKKEDETNLREIVPEKSDGIVGETGGQFKEDPYTFVSPDDPILSACM